MYSLKDILIKLFVNSLILVNFYSFSMNHTGQIGQKQHIVLNFGPNAGKKGGCCDKKASNGEEEPYVGFDTYQEKAVYGEIKSMLVSPKELHPKELHKKFKDDSFKIPGELLTLQLLHSYEEKNGILPKRGIEEHKKSIESSYFSKNGKLLIRSRDNYFGVFSSEDPLKFSSSRNTKLFNLCDIIRTYCEKIVKKPVGEQDNSLNLRIRKIFINDYGRNFVVVDNIGRGYFFKVQYEPEFSLKLVYIKDIIKNYEFNDVFYKFFDDGKKIFIGLIFSNHNGNQSLRVYGFDFETDKLFCNTEKLLDINLPERDLKFEAFKYDEHKEIGLFCYGGKSGNVYRSRLKLKAGFFCFDNKWDILYALEDADIFTISKNNGAFVASCDSERCTCLVYDVEKNKKIFVSEHMGYDEGVIVDFLLSDNGKYLVFFTDYRSVFVYNLEKIALAASISDDGFYEEENYEDNPFIDLRTYYSLDEGNSDNYRYNVVTRIFIDDKNNILVFGCENCYVMAYDIEKGVLLSRIDNNYCENKYCGEIDILEVEGDGRYVLSGQSKAGKIMICDIKDGKVLFRQENPENNGPLPKSVYFDESSKRYKFVGLDAYNRKILSLGLSHDVCFECDKITSKKKFLLDFRNKLVSSIGKNGKKENYGSKFSDVSIKCVI